MEFLHMRIEAEDTNQVNKVIFTRLFIGVEQEISTPYVNMHEGEGQE